MRKTVKLIDGWKIRSFPPTKEPASAWRQANTREGDWLATDVPKAVQEVLWQAGLLDQTVLETGEAEDCRWVSDLDWAFCTTFTAARGKQKTFLFFKGLDTYADIILNGEKIGSHASLYQPLRLDISSLVAEKNELMVYFHSPFALIDEIKKHIPADQMDKLTPLGLMRKGIDDLSAHAGVLPYFCPIGIYDDVELITVPRGVMRYVDTEITWNQHRTQAYVSLRAPVDYAEGQDRASLRATLYGPDGEVVVTQEGDTSATPTLRLTVDHPQLWWPRNYGDHPLYRLKTELIIDGVPADVDERQIGFREIREVGPLHFLVNGVQVRLWGSCMVPMWGATHQYQEERALTLLDLAEQANMNALRFWGPSQQYSDALYEELDHRGFLVWHDFPTSGTHMSEDPGFVACVSSEVTAMIRRLKHHPCILLWCGGNESVYMCDLFDPKAEKRIGHTLVHDTLRKIAFDLDPHRPYRASSPIGGAYANDVSIDSHGSRASLCYLPNEKYGNFFSENIRTSLPEWKSIQRFIPQKELWPEGWTDRVPYGRTEFLPPAWQRRTMNHWAEKLGPIERFYDADTPEQLVYKINAATAYDMRLTMNACRRGKEYALASLDRRCFGHMVWKLTTSWPQMYCALIDYYLEPGQVYYALRRAFAPVQVSINVEDHVYLWGVNDTREAFTGAVRIRIFDLETETDVHTETRPVSILPGESRILLNLDHVGQFPFTSAVEAVLVGSDGEAVSQDVQYMKAERYLPFPDADISLECLPDGCLRVSSDRFVRCVELSGDDQGDVFGWYFEDNYFDLFPGESKILRILGRHTSGTVSAKGHYASKRASVTWHFVP